MIRILHGDCRERLRELPAESVHCVVTSPPYWGLRNYNVEGQIGLESCLGEHIDTLVDVFREVRRVLRKDGTVWLNYGDAYACAPNGRSAAATKALAQDDRTFRDKPISTVGAVYVGEYERTARGKTQNMGNLASAHAGRIVGNGTLKPKDRMLLPARVAIALQEDGWWVRDEIIWHKPNPMPSSVKDRTTPAHEMIYLLSKSPKYYFDQEAIRTPFSGETKLLSFETMDFGARDRYKKPDGWDTGAGAHGTHHRSGRQKGSKVPEGYVPPAGANRRSVWTIPPKGFKEAHFATFPPALIEPCIKAGCPVGGTVLDPFFGAGTTGLVCQQLGRDCIGIELNAEYIGIAERRLGMAPVSSTESLLA